jgi:transcriptional regulator with XRE-family HTH domain
LITAAQIKAARKLLGWHRGMVALKARAGVSGNTVGKAEGAFRGMPPTPDQLDAIKEALEAAGIEFTEGDEPGVKLKVAVTRAALRP